MAFHWPDTSKLELKGLSLDSATLLTADGPKPIAIQNGNTLVGLPMESPNRIAGVFDLKLKLGSDQQVSSTNVPQTADN